MNEYKIYDKDGKLLVTGNAHECADALQMTIHSFYSMISKVNAGTSKKYTIEIIYKGSKNYRG